MRLLEPLSGIKMMQGHLLVHLAFFFAIFFIKNEHNLNDGEYVDPCRQDLEASETHLSFMHYSTGVIGHGESSSNLEAEDYMINLSGGGHDDSCITPDPCLVHSVEKRMLWLLQWGHLWTFLWICIFFVVKRKEDEKRYYPTLAQIL